MKMSSTLRVIAICFLLVASISGCGRNSKADDVDLVVSKLRQIDPLTFHEAAIHIYKVGKSGEDDLVKASSLEFRNRLNGLGLALYSVGAYSRPNAKDVNVRDLSVSLYIGKVADGQSLCVLIWLIEKDGTVSIEKLGDEEKYEPFKILCDGCLYKAVQARQ